MNNLLESSAIRTLKHLVIEQDTAPVTSKETDNSTDSSKDSPFTPAEERFLGKFDAYGTKHLGIIYSPSDIGIREFIMRSGKDLNCTPEILLSMIRNKIVKIVPYTGFGRNTDYTIELQLSLNDIAGLGSEDKKKAEAGSGASGAPAAGGMDAPMPGGGAPMPEVAWVVKYGDILNESALILKRLLNLPITEDKQDKINVYTDKSRLLKRFPKEFIQHMSRLLRIMDKKTKNTLEKERLIADVLDNLQINLNLSPKHIKQSYEMHKGQKRLQKFLKK